MTDLNSFNATARLTQNAELKYTTNGTACAKFSIAINKSYKQGNEWTKKAGFFNCVIWGKYAESMHRYLTKGKQIAIEAELAHNPWTDANETRHNDVNLVIKNIVLLSSPKNAENRQTENTQTPLAEPANLDDIPF